MKPVVMLLFLLCISLDVSAQSARFGSRMVSVGDSVDRVREVAGAPEAIEPANPEAGDREHWTYRRKGRLIQLWLAEGKVVHVQDQKDQGGV